MEKVLRDVVKTGLLLFAVGVLLSFAVAPIAAAISVPFADVAVMANPLWLGSFFGAMGAVQAGITPLFNAIFGGDKPAGETSIDPRDKSATKQLNLTIVQSPQQSQGMAVVENKHRQSVEAQRIVLLAGEQTPGM